PHLTSRSWGGRSSPALRALLIRDVIRGLRSLHSLTQVNIPTPLRDWLTGTSMTLCWFSIIDVIQRRILYDTSTLYCCPRPYGSPFGRRAKPERGHSQNKCRGGH